MKQLLAITRKEIAGYFGSPMALIFVGAFLAVTLFSFFWVNTFFARGIADVRPLFQWMPLLMIFLVAALTMRQWSEEQRSGTLEVLMTLPVRPIQLVVGKFLAVMALVALALALTMFLPITVSLLGNLDWGPVVGGYLAAILLAAAYAAMGLFVSSRTDNQIVSLMLTVVLCGFFYLIGSSGVTDFVGNRFGDILRAVGSGSRFSSILRGVVDLRDLIYYLALTAVFLMLNVFSLDSKRWSTGERTRPYRLAATLTTVLVVANLVLANVWLYPLSGLRVDLTTGRDYSLSQTTRELMSNLQEPLLLRGYFSEKTHPLLAPLVPTISDMLEEYRIASRGKVELDIVDPAEDPDKEAEANQSYGISPTPFQIAGRYETSIINSYFDILVRYGDQYETLNFQDLIEVESLRDGTIDVRLRNLEYDLTSSIKKAVYGFQSVGAVLASFETPASLTLYVTQNTLPQWLADVPATIEKVAGDIGSAAPGKFTYSLVDPDQAGAPVSRQELYDRYGIRPYATSLFSSDSYYLHMVLQVGDEPQVIYPQGELTEADVRTAIESALKRSSKGFLKVVGIWTPPAEPTVDMYGRQQNPVSTWNAVGSTLGEEYEVRTIDLSSGQVAADVDALLVVAPRNLTDKERFAIDQYLMRGGALIVAAGNYGITIDQYYGGLALMPLDEGLQEMLASYGITVEKSLVMDPQNEAFPMPVVRQVGQYQVQEYQALDYPFFVDVRSNGMASGNPIVSNLQAITLNWASPITIDETKNSTREVTELLKSTTTSWTQTDTNISPDFTAYPNTGFAVGTDLQSRTLAVAVRGSFESFFKGKASPLAQPSEAEAATPAPENVPGTIEASPETARLVVFGSAEFVDDTILQVSSQMSGDRYRNSLQVIQNAVSWSTEDLDLLDIRSRGTQARVLTTLTESDQTLWEGANYALALLALVAIGVLWATRRRNEQPMPLTAPSDK
jgi:ABC-2 type transport system permease protein